VGVAPTSLQLSPITEVTDLARLAQVNDDSDVLGANQHDDPIDDPFDERSDRVADVQEAMAESRARLGGVPAEIVVTNHVMGLYELAAIHLSSMPPNLLSAALAIDAVACLVEGLEERLGEDAATMRDALANIRLAFVSVKSASAK
jgi:hypothetical protein